MSRKQIFIIEDDPKTEASLREILGKDFELEGVGSDVAAVAYLTNRHPDLIIIDYDLKAKDGLQLFKELRPLSKVIMLSFTDNISIAVAAAKAGVAEFVRKPVEAGLLREAVNRNIRRPEEKVVWGEGMEWLRGESLRMKQMLNEILAAIKTGKNLILIGERGIEKDKLVQFIHSNGLKKERKIVTLDLSSFRRESLEAHFWMTMQDFVAKPVTTSVLNEADLCGTLFLEKVDSLDDLFKTMLFNFFQEKNKIDQNVRLVMGLYEPTALQKQKTEGWIRIEIPTLRERKEDIPYLMNLYLKRYALFYNKNINRISTELLDFLVSYDFPGNYLELERMIQAAVLNAAGEVLEMKHLPLAMEALLQSSLKKYLGEYAPLEKAKRSFEKNLYAVLLDKAEGDHTQVAQFVDLPKTALSERFKDLTD